jgi:hypothetical protein
MIRRVLWLLSALAFTPVAGAITQPNGTVIPVGDELQRIFTERGETLRVREDAAIMPERFLPGCRLTFTLISRGASQFRNIFGWYNVRPGMRPDPADLHVLIPCNATAGNRFELNLRGNPDYRGGEIGFFLRTPQDGTPPNLCPGACCADLSRGGYNYFSERQYNPDNMGANSVLHLLIYDSRVQRNAFYFTWEDLFAGGDNNFTDFVALVDQIVCTGAGGACATGERGVCAAGTQQCRNGALACQRSVAPSGERCDGLDNDCDGDVDEGDGLCPGEQLCDRGTCVVRCLSELGCYEGLTCTPRGTCVESGCATVTCPSGQRCAAGRCVESCEGIRCPAGRVCRAGRCADPCAGVTCDSDQVCVAGDCVPRCECRSCASGQRCAADGRCVAERCATVTCPAGQTCADGACVDACAGATCPVGERCEVGACVPVPVMDAGAARDVVLPTVDLGARDDVADAATPMDLGAEGGRVTLDVNDRGRSGCSCRVGASAPARGVVPFALLALCARRRRRVRCGSSAARGCATRSPL